MRLKIQEKMLVCLIFTAFSKYDLKGKNVHFELQKNMHCKYQMN